MTRENLWIQSYAYFPSARVGASAPTLCPSEHMISRHNADPSTEFLVAPWWCSSHGPMVNNFSTTTRGQWPFARRVGVVYNESYASTYMTGIIVPSEINIPVIETSTSRASLQMEIFDTGLESIWTAEKKILSTFIFSRVI